MAVSVHLKQFDGPLDLLLHLVDKAKIDLRDIFISEITEQYLSIISTATDFNMDEASEFLTIAAVLVEIKSRKLLPREKENEDEEDPEAMLLQRLEEYKLFKETAESMTQFEAAACKVFGKLPEEYPLPPPTLDFDGLTLKALWDALRRIQDRAPTVKEELAVPNRNIIRDAYSVEERIEVIESRLQEGSIRFEALLSAHPNKEEIVTLFIALLEVLKLGKAHVVQGKTFDEIWVEPGRMKEFVEFEPDDGYGNSSGLPADH